MSISPIPSVVSTPAPAQNATSAPTQNAKTAPVQKENVSAAEAVLEPEYSTKAGGKTWSADIEPIGEGSTTDGYTATVPNLPGATTSGPTIERVENTLSDLISFFA